MQDGRFERFKKPTYVFTNFIDKDGKQQNIATEQVPLEIDEVYGFLKARFPNRDTKSEILKEVKERLQKEIIDNVK